MEIVYLIHFEEPLGHMQHYIGYTKNFARRLKEHRSNRGARLLRAVNKAGIQWQVIRTWEGSRKLESKLKKGGGKRLCPICNPDTYHRYITHLEVKREGLLPGA